MTPAELIVDVEFDPVSFLQYIQLRLLELSVLNVMPSSLALTAFKTSF